MSNQPDILGGTGEIPVMFKWKTLQTGSPSAFLYIYILAVLCKLYPEQWKCRVLTARLPGSPSFSPVVPSAAPGTLPLTLSPAPLSHPFFPGFQGALSPAGPYYIIAHPSSSACMAPIPQFSPKGLFQGLSHHLLSSWNQPVEQ